MYRMLYSTSLFLSLFSYSFSLFAGKTSDPDVIRAITTYTVSVFDLGDDNISYCKRWAYIFDDKEAIKSSSTGNIYGKLECEVWDSVNKNTYSKNVYDNLNYIWKKAIFHRDLIKTTYLCSNGIELSTDTCNVEGTHTGCTCPYCAAWKTKRGKWVCFSKIKGKSYPGSECSNRWNPAKPGYGCIGGCGAEQYYCVDYYDNTSTPKYYYKEYYTYKLYKPELKLSPRDILKVYDPNMVNY